MSFLRLLSSPSAPVDPIQILQDAVSDTIARESTGFVMRSIPIIEGEKDRLANAIGIDRQIIGVGILVSLTLALLSPFLLLLIVPSVVFGLYSLGTHRKELDRVIYAVRLINEEITPIFPL